MLKKLFRYVAEMPKPMFVSRLYRILSLLLIPQRYKRGGIVYLMNPNDHIMRTEVFIGVYELSERRVFREFAAIAQLVIDVGANVGVFTADAAKCMAASGEIIAFEPDTTNASLLNEMVSINGFKNVTIERKALADKGGNLRLYLSDDNMGDHRLMPAEESRNFIEIEAVRLDDYLLGRVPQLIKMDIQGSEILALRGMIRTLDAMHDGAVLLEFWPYALRRSQTNPKELLDLFLSTGFTAWRITSQPGHLIAIEYELLLSLKLENESVNLLFVKGKQSTDIVLKLLKQ